MSLTHRMSNTRLHSIWKSMRTRCNNPNAKYYKNYGGRGISICSEWEDFMNFYLWAINNGYSEELTLDRINVNGNYEPSNCRWLSRKEQCRNKRYNVKVLYNGKLYTPPEIAEITGISVYTIYDAHKNGGINDFTNYVPRVAKVKNISDRGGRFEIWIRGKYEGSYKTIDEAIKRRDEILSGQTNTGI